MSKFYFPLSENDYFSETIFQKLAFQGFTLKKRIYVPPWNINSMLATSEITSDFSGSNPAEEAPVNRPNRDRCNLDLRIFDIISVPV